MANQQDQAYSLLAERLHDRGLNVQSIQSALKRQVIETPSWGYADSGTRFGVFAQPGAAVTIAEKLSDAAQVHKHTGVAPNVGKKGPQAALRQLPGEGPEPCTGPDSGVTHPCSCRQRAKATV